jgi:hypothetical protein
VVSGGYGVRVEHGDNAFSAGLAFQHHALRQRKHVKSSAVDPENPGFSSARTWGRIEVFSLELGVEF